MSASHTVMDTVYPSWVDTWLLDIRGNTLESEATHLQIQPATGQAKDTGRLGNIAPGSIEGRGDEVPLDGLNRSSEVAGLDRESSRRARLGGRRLLPPLWSCQIG